MKLIVKCYRNFYLSTKNERWRGKTSVGRSANPCMDYIFSHTVDIRT